ncbi:hypothetical protein HYC85_029130 [Camellia sinensis]|uniref:Uncharacterized protein n=1 Tax=Camellia sinensis TaxID=4442 RepID=A0A7J7FXD0_CAMSI|nr:hypothetical protein HYC85_029130 [Camellia sinensis]
MAGKRSNTVWKLLRQNGCIYSVPGNEKAHLNSPKFCNHTCGSSYILIEPNKLVPQVVAEDTCILAWPGCPAAQPLMCVREKVIEKKSGERKVGGNRHCLWVEIQFPWMSMQAMLTYKQRAMFNNLIIIRNSMKFDSEKAIPQINKIKLPFRFPDGLEMRE